MGSTFKLVFQTILAGSGFAKLDAQTSSLQKKLGKMSQGVSILGRGFGKLGGMIGSSIGMLLQGGIWGAAATVATAAVTKIIDKWKEHKKAVEETNKEIRRLKAGYAKGWDTDDFRHDAYKRRVEGYKQADEAAKKDEADAAKAEAESRKRLVESMKDANKLERDYYALESQIALEKMKSGLESEKENERLKAKVQLALAASKAKVEAAERDHAIATREWEGGFGVVGEVDLARKRLELAKAEAETVKASAKREVEAYRERKRAAKEEEERKAEMAAFEFEEEQKRRRDRERGERKIAEIRQKAAADAAAVEAKIADLKKKGAEWEEAAKRARGVSFGDWRRGERDREREERRAERAQRGREGQVDRELDRLIHTNPKLRTAWQKNRIGQLMEWKRAQDEANNPANAAIDQLEEEKRRLAEKSEKHLADISQAMKNLGL